MILVTGGAGFIGSHFVNGSQENIVIVDKMTYAADLKRIKRNRVNVLRENIRSVNAMLTVLETMKPKAIFHFAAETHVTKSITDPAIFFKNNVDGTLNLLHATLEYWEKEQNEDFRFVHISTDEVFGSLDDGGVPFTEKSPYLPSTPYAASKAASDHLVRCFWVTYGLPTITLNSTNNYGPGQHKEKLIPLVINAAKKDLPITVHGDGLGTRDWIHVDDFCDAVKTVYEKGTPGESYCVGAQNEKTVLEVVNEICDLVGKGHDRIVHVEDRPGNDRRYAVNPEKISKLGWEPKRPWSLEALI